jgi:hypothetical protein
MLTNRQLVGAILVAPVFLSVPLATYLVAGWMGLFCVGIVLLFLVGLPLIAGD